MAAKGFSLITLVFLALSLAPAFGQLDLTVDRVEVTQVIQDRNIATGEDNIIRLVAYKPTVARLYVGFTGSSQPVPDVYAVILVFQNGVEVEGSPVYPDGPITAPVPPGAITRVDPRSSTETATLNFFLPHVVGENVTLVAFVNPDFSIVETNYDNNFLFVEGLNFECRRVPDIAYQPVDYRPTAPSGDPNVPDPVMIGPWVGDVFVRAIYPVYNIEYREVPGGPVRWTQNINTSAGAFHTQAATRRRLMDPMPDILYSWFPGNPFSGNGQASPSGMVAFGNTAPDRFQRTFAHEMGHLFGLGHNNRRIIQVGFDTYDLLGLGRVKAASLFDIMVGGQLTRNAWVDIPTYNAFLNRPLIRCPTGAEGGSAKHSQENVGDYLFLTGNVNPDGRARLNPAYQLYGTQDFTPNNENPTHVLILQDRAGNELYRVAFDARAEWDGDTEANAPDIESGFSLVLPAFDQVGRVLLVQDGTVLDVIERRAQGPMITIEPSPGFNVGENRVSWLPINGAPGEFTYSVQYSPDHGGSWFPIAVNITDTNLLLNNTVIGKAHRGTIRILATDGLNTTVIEQSGINIF